MNSLVTGASRGVGRGIASVLASESGSSVFATGRTIAAADLPANVTRIPCDHTDDAQTAAAFERAGDIDLLVNSAWGGYETVFEDGAFAFHLPFWHKPAHRWTAMIDAGARATFMCSAHAARNMAPRRAGLIVNIGYWAAQKYGPRTSPSQHCRNLALSRIGQDRSHHGRRRVSRSFQQRKPRVHRPRHRGASPRSRVNGAERRSPCRRALAQEYGILDIDGRRPEPLTLTSS